MICWGGGGGCAPLSKGSGDAPVDAPQFPSWFWETPLVDEVEVAVGYAPTYYTFTSSVNEAFDDAARRLWRDRYCRIQSVEAYSTTGAERMFMGRIFRFSYPEEGFEDFKKSLVIVDTFAMPELTSVLVATKPFSIEKRLIPSPDNSPILSIGPNTPRGFGIGQLYYYWANSFREAEEFARINLAYSTWCKVLGLDLSDPQNLLKVSELQTDLILTGIKSVRRRLSLNPPYVEIIVKAQSFSLP